MSWTPHWPSNFAVKSSKLRFSESLTCVTGIVVTVDISVAFTLNASKDVSSVAVKRVDTEVTGEMLP
jgi:hypothetical protein